MGWQFTISGVLLQRQIRRTFALSTKNKNSDEKKGTIFGDTGNHFGCCRRTSPHPQAGDERGELNGSAR
jgi:hypothetical protein